MIVKDFEKLLKKLDLPESEEVELTPESIELLKEFGLHVESADSSEDTKADREVVD